MLASLGRLSAIAAATAGVLVVTLVQPTDAPAVVAADDSPLAIPPLVASPVPAPEPGNVEGEGSEPVERVDAIAPLAEPSTAPGRDGVPNVAALPVVARSERSTTYDAGGGAFVEEFSEQQLNTQLDSGEWVAISTNIERSADGWEVPSHPLQPRFASDAGEDRAVSVSIDGHEVSFALIGANSTDVAAPFWWWDDGSTLTYRNALDGADLKYEVLPNSVKETVILDALPTDGRTSWVWRVETGGLAAQIDERGALQLLDGDEVVASSPTPIAWDSSGTTERWRGEIELDASVRALSPGVWEYTVKVDETWLTSGNRVFPISIDPQLNAGPNFRESFKSDGARRAGELLIGNPNEPGRSENWRALTRMDYGAVPGNTIEDAWMTGVSGRSDNVRTRPGCSRYVR